MLDEQRRIMAPPWSPVLRITRGGSPPCRPASRLSVSSRAPITTMRSPGRASRDQPRGGVVAVGDVARIAAAARDVGDDVGAADLARDGAAEIDRVGQDQHVVRRHAARRTCVDQLVRASPSAGRSRAAGTGAAAARERRAACRAWRRSCRGCARNRRSPRRRRASPTRSKRRREAGEALDRRAASASGTPAATPRRSRRARWRRCGARAPAAAPGRRLAAVAMQVEARWRSGSGDRRVAAQIRPSRLDREVVTSSRARAASAAASASSALATTAVSARAMKSPNSARSSSQRLVVER